MIKTHRFRTLIDKHKEWIFTYAFYFTGDRADAEDVTQEVMLRLWQHLEKIRLGSAGAWIRKTTRNLCIDSRRRRIRYRSDTELADQIPGALDDPIDRTQSSMLSEVIYSALQHLPDKHRSVLIMREIQDMSYREISACLNIPLNSTKVFLWRARSALRRRLSETLKRELQDAEIV